MGTILRYWRGPGTTPAVTGLVRGLAETVLLGAAGAAYAYGAAEVLPGLFPAASAEFIAASSGLWLAVRTLEGWIDAIDPAKRRAPARRPAGDRPERSRSS